MPIVEFEAPPNQRAHHASSRTRAKQFLDEYLGHRNVAAGLGHIAVPSGNHDMDRMGYGRDTQQLKACFALLACLPGVPFIYYGDEIGMDKLEGLPSKEGGYNRTGSRTPMQWGPGPQRGFSKAALNKLYLPVDKRAAAPTVAAQEQDAHSLLMADKVTVEGSGKSWLVKTKGVGFGVFEL